MPSNTMKASLRMKQISEKDTFTSNKLLSAPVGLSSHSVKKGFIAELSQAQTS